MVLRRGFRYRLYPTPEQEARLRAWEGALRALWNAAHEQRFLYLRRGARQRSAFDQINQLTELRAEVPWLADVPRNVCAQLLVDLDAAWQRCFKGLAGRPRWKKKGRDAVAITEPHPSVFRVTATGVVFPKLGEIRARLHRPLWGTPKRCTIRRDVDQWFASIQCEEEVAAPEPRRGPTVAIDRGLTVLLADSDGRFVPNPKHLERTLCRLARAQRVVARRQKGSRRRHRAVLRVATLHRKVRRQRTHVLHVLSHRYAKSHGVVVVEKLNVAGMVRGGLGRHIAGAGWSSFCTMLRYKLEATGGTLVEVPAAYSSQTCPTCGLVDAASRQGNHFRCVGCEHEAHADLNAAVVLLSRRTDGDAGRGGQGAVRPPMKRQLRVVRRGHSTPHVGAPPKAPDSSPGEGYNPRVTAPVATTAAATTVERRGKAHHIRAEAGGDP
ncbi:MAG TPA: transposase [Methylomirabilota bacterium]|nr:transposase [Methylomirabilota bacterium]